jgi:UTP--glucose-1-phosphate uridylyltransferase
MIALSKQEDFFAVRFDGQIYDTGSKIGFLTANVAYALDRDDLAAPLRKEIQSLLGKAKK